MGFKEFKADLAKAESATFDRVSNLRKGDSEGDFAFSYAPENSTKPIEIQVLAQSESILRYELS